MRRDWMEYLLVGGAGLVVGLGLVELALIVADMVACISTLRGL